MGSAEAVELPVELPVGLEDVVCVRLDDGLALGVTLWLVLGELVGLLVPPCEALWVDESDCEPACDGVTVDVRPPVTVCVELRLRVVDWLPVPATLELSVWEGVAVADAVADLLELLVGDAVPVDEPLGDWLADCVLLAVGAPLAVDDPADRPRMVPAETVWDSEAMQSALAVDTDDGVPDGDTPWLRVLEAVTEGEAVCRRGRGRRLTSRDALRGRLAAWRRRALRRRLAAQWGTASD